jgi:hypothetical protein
MRSASRPLWVKAGAWSPCHKSRRGGPGLRQQLPLRSLNRAGVGSSCRGNTRDRLLPKPAFGRNTRRRIAQPREAGNGLPVSPTGDGAEPGISQSSMGKGTLLCSCPRNRRAFGAAETATPREGRTCGDLPVGKPTTDVTGRTKSTTNLGSPIAAGVAPRCPRVVRG